MKRAPLYVLAVAAVVLATRTPNVETPRPQEIRKPVSEVSPASSPAVPASLSRVEIYRLAKERRDWREMKRLREAATSGDYDPAQPLLSAELLDLELPVDDDPARFRFFARTIRGSAHLASVLQTHPDFETRRAAALALGRHGVPEILPHLEAIEGDLADFVLVKMHLRGVIRIPEHRIAGLDAENLALLRGEAIPEEDGALEFRRLGESKGRGASVPVRGAKVPMLRPPK